MAQHTSWRLLAISAAVAVMLTACGGGNGNSSGSEGASTNVSAGSNGGGAPATIKPAVSVRLIVNGDTVTVEALDEDGNPVSYSGDVAITAGDTTFPGGATTGTVGSNGTFTINPGANGTSFELPGLIDPNTGTPFTASVPGVRFGPNGTDRLDVVLIGTDGTPLTSGPDQATVNSPITTDTTVGLGTGSGSVALDPNAPAGVQSFTLTDPDTGNTFTGLVDTGSYTDDNGHYLLGCNAHSPVQELSTHADAGMFTLLIDGNVVTTAVTEQDTTAKFELKAGSTYAYGFKLKYLDSTGHTELTNVSRAVRVKIMAGEADGTGTGSLVTVSSQPIEMSMANGEGAQVVTFTPVRNTDDDKYKNAFVLRMTDHLCVKKKPGSFYDRVFNVTP